LSAVWRGLLHAEDRREVSEDKRGIERVREWKGEGLKGRVKIKELCVPAGRTYLYKGEVEA